LLGSSSLYSSFPLYPPFPFSPHCLQTSPEIYQTSHRRPLAAFQPLFLNICPHGPATRSRSLQLHQNCYFLAEALLYLMFFAPSKSGRSSDISTIVSLDAGLSTDEDQMARFRIRKFPYLTTSA